MKLVRTAILAAALLCATVISAQQKPARYDIGVCGEKDFVAAHIEVSDEKVTVLTLSTGPDQEVKLPHPVDYTFTFVDKEGRHYQSDGKFQLVVFKKTDDVIIAKSLDPDGNIIAVVYGGKDEDGSKLLENAKSQFSTCVDLQKADDADESKT